MSKPNLDWQPDILNSITAYTPSIRATIKASPTGYDTFRDEKEYCWCIFDRFKSALCASGRADTQEKAKEAVLKWLYPFDAERLQKVADAAYQQKEDVTVIGPPGEMQPWHAAAKSILFGDDPLPVIGPPGETVERGRVCSDRNIQSIPKFVMALPMARQLPYPVRNALDSAQECVEKLDRILKVLEKYLSTE